jgi:hypothetical protein
VNPRWVRIRSWHIVLVRGDDWTLTRCGRRAGKEVVDDLPANEKTCETCLRLRARDEERH